MPTIAIIDIKEHFCSVALFDEGWKGNTLIHSNLVQGSFLDKSGSTAIKVKSEISNYIDEGCSVILLIPRSIVHVMSVDIPAKNETLLKKMMQFEVTRRFPIQSTHLIYDYFIVERKEGGFVIDLAGFKSEDFGAYYEAATDAGIHPDVVSLSSAAWIDPSGKKGASGKRTFIEVLPEGFEMSMVDGKRLVYSRFNRFKPKIEEDYFFRRQTMGESITSRIADAISDELNHISLVSGIEQMGSYLNEVYIAGGGVLQGSLNSLLSQKQGFSSSSITTLQSSGGESGFGHVAQAMGEAGLDEKFRFNFLPLELRRKSLTDEKRRFRMFAIVIAILALLWPAASYYSSWSSLKNLRSELSRLRAEAGVVEKTQIRIGEYKSYFDTFEKFSNSHSFTLEILNDLTTTLPKHTYLREIEVRRDELMISGSSSDASALIKKLESSKNFKDVRFASAIKTDNGQEKFKIGMRYE